MRLPGISALSLLTLLNTAAPVFGQAGPTPQRDVFVVGADTAIGDPLLDFKPTRVEYTHEAMDANGRRDLVRMLLMEQGFAHRALPLGAPGLVLHANGRLTVDSETLKRRMYKNGESVAAGDRIMVTDISVLPDRIYVDVKRLDRTCLIGFFATSPSTTCRSQATARWAKAQRVPASHCCLRAPRRACPPPS